MVGSFLFDRKGTIYLKTGKSAYGRKVDAISIEAVKTNGLISATIIGKWGMKRSSGLNKESNF